MVRMKSDAIARTLDDKHSSHAAGWSAAVTAYSFELGDLIETQERDDLHALIERQTGAVITPGNQRGAIAVTLPPPLADVTLQLTNVQSIDTVLVTGKCACGAYISGDACVRGRCLVCELDKAVDDAEEYGEQQCPRCKKLAALTGIAANGDAVCGACLDALVAEELQP